MKLCNLPAITLATAFIMRPVSGEMAPYISEPVHGFNPLTALRPLEHSGFRLTELSLFNTTDALLSPPAETFEFPAHLLQKRASCPQRGVAESVAGSGSGSLSPATSGSDSGKVVHISVMVGFGIVMLWVYIKVVTEVVVRSAIF
jgi:hypothetical protein